MKHTPDHLWQRDVIVENAEIHELQRCTAQFKADIRAALLDAEEENTRRAYAGQHDTERAAIAYFGQLVERTFSAIPTRILEDATELSTVLQSCAGMLQPAYAKSVFAAIPNTLLVYPAILDACANLCQEPLSLFVFCGLSEEKQHNISGDWFESFWNNQVINADDSPLPYVPPGELPWSILHPAQEQHALEHMLKNDLRDFSRIPHSARSSDL